MKTAIACVVLAATLLGAAAAARLTFAPGDTGPNGDTYIVRPHTRPTFAPDESWNPPERDVYIGWGPPARGVTVYGGTGSQTLPVPQPQLPPAR